MIITSQAPFVVSILRGPLLSEGRYFRDFVTAKFSERFDLSGLVEVLHIETCISKQNFTQTGNFSSYPIFSVDR